jgi:hypothetical protein
MEIFAAETRKIPVQSEIHCSSSRSKPTRRARLPQKPVDEAVLEREVSRFRHITR